MEYKQTIGRWQWALGSKKANTREQLAQIRHQQAVRNQPLRLGFLNSDLPAACCILPTSLPWRLGLPARRAYSPEGAINFGEIVLVNISKGSVTLPYTFSPYTPNVRREATPRCGLCVHQRAEHLWAHCLILHSSLVGQSEAKDAKSSNDPHRGGILPA